MIYIYLVILTLTNVISYFVGKKFGVVIEHYKLPTLQLVKHVSSGGHKYVIKRHNETLISTNDGCIAREEWERQAGSAGMEWFEDGQLRMSK